MRKIASVGLSLCLLIVAPHILFADGGKIPFRPHVKIFEPNQNAMIAWNGEEEILLLTTNIRSSEPTKVLEIVPFPSEPKAKKGDSEVIRKAVNLINSKLPSALPRASPSKRHRISAGGAKPKPPAGELTFHDKIGSHDISVTHVLNKEGFVDWVQKYLKSAGVDNPEIPEDMQKVVEEYLTDGFNWFVFDVVDVKEDVATTEAIQYQFKTKSLFYPMRISRAIQGDSQVKLLVLTRNNVLVTKEVGANWRRPFSPIHVEQSETRSIDDDMAKIFRPGEKMVLRIWEFNGRLSSFTNDLIGESSKYLESDTKLGYLITERNGTALVAAATQADLIQVRKLLDCGFGANWPATRPGSIVGEGYRPPPPRYVGFTALQNSAQNGYADIVKLLLDRGAEVNLSTISGGSPLMQAAANGRVDVVRVLLKKGANVNLSHDKGRTALHGAAEKGYDEVVKLLLRNGADVAAKTSDGKTALQLAAERGHTGTVKILRSHGARE